MQVSVVLHTLTGFVSTNQLTLRNSKKFRFFPVLWKKERKMSQGKRRRKASLTTFRAADEPRVPQVAEIFFKTGNQKEETQCWLLKEAPTPSAQETQSDESGSAFCGKKTQEHE